MNKFYTLVAALLLTSTLSAAEPKPLTPEQQAVKEAEERLAEAKKAEIERKEKEKAAAKAEWATKTHLEAWQIRGQRVVDGAQYLGGQAVRVVANADGYAGSAVAYPAAYLTAGAFGLAESSKSYANNAWNNEKVEVAAKAPEQK